MMTFATMSGSRYELDTEGKRMRRLGGRNEPTPRQGVDGQWRRYVTCLPSSPVVGSRFVVVWEITPEDTARSTMTSPVVVIEVAGEALSRAGETP
jgi:hypothetical protein